jgi:hypothetical protein
MIYFLGFLYFISDFIQFMAMTFPIYLEF